MAGNNNLQFRTYIYRRFKEEFSLLGRTHWYLEYSAKSTSQQIAASANLSTDKFVDEMLPLPDFDNHRLHITPNEFIAQADAHIAHLRLLLVVNVCAVLEEYLHRYTHYYAIHMGHVDIKFNRVTEEGCKKIKNVLVSNLQSSLTRFQQLTDCNVTDQIQIINEAYQIRCAVAHNGGIVDREVSQKLPKYKEMIGKRICLSWQELNVYLMAIYDVATQVDECLPVNQIRSIEVNWLLQDIFDSENGITAKAARTQMISEYNYPEGIPDAKAIATRFNCAVK